jgi:chromosome segregation ATPase
MASFFARHGAGEILARYSFIEPLLTGRRVLELGAAAATAGASALLLAERGAAAVLSLAEGEALQTARAAGHHPFVRFDDISIESLPAGAFDLVLLADGAALADDPARLTGLRRLLAAGGHLVTAIPAGGGRSLAELAGDTTPVQAPGYEGFIAALTEHFPWVEVATQSASVGYIIAVPPPEGTEPEVSIDGSQAGDADAAAYVVLCGEGPTGLSGITMVALPSRQLLDAAVSAREAAAAGAVQAGGAVAALEARVVALTAAGEAATGELVRLAQERGAVTAERDTLMLQRQLASEEREALLQDREVAMTGLAEARAELGRLEQLREERVGGRRELEQSLERLRGVEALCDAEREAGAAARADAERLGGQLGLRERELNEVRHQQESLRQRLAEAELEAARLGEERTRAVTELAERSGAGAESEAALQAARAEAQVARSVLEGSLARADAAEGRVQEMEEGLDARVSELSALRAELEAGRAQLGGAAELEITLRARAEGAETALQAASGELDRLREEAVTARGESDVALREIDGARGEAARATAVLAELRVELRATGEALEESRAQAEASRAELGESRTQQAAAHAQLEEARTQAEASRAQLEAWRAEIEVLRGEVARLGEALELARNAPAPAPASVAAPSPELEARVAELGAEAARLEEASRQLAEQAAHAAGERDALAAQLDEAHRAADREREQLVGQLDEAHGIIQGAADRLRELEAQRASAEEEARLQRERFGEAQSRARDIEAKLAEARKETEAAQGQAAEIDAELQAVRWEKEEVEQRLVTMQQPDGPAPAGGGEAGGAGAAAEVLRLRSELEALRGELEPLRAQLAMARGGEEGRDLELAGLRAELSRVQGELAERSTSPSLDVAPERLSRLVAEKEALAAAIADRDLKLSRLHREVTDKTERLSRLAMELGELKAKGIGKIFR